MAHFFSRLMKCAIASMNTMAAIVENVSIGGTRSSILSIRPPIARNNPENTIREDSVLCRFTQEYVKDGLNFSGLILGG